MRNEDEPKLAEPGAGLPKLELFLMRRGFPKMCRFRSRKSFCDLFDRERDHLLITVASLSDEQASERVLIKRIRSLEDSSRYWSAYMTLQHLHIVNLSVAGIVRALGRGEAFQQVVRIEDVKPDPEVGPEVVGEFEKSAEVLRKTCAAVDELNTKATHGHPWFGELNPRGWHALSAVHMGIHRKQMDLIVAGL